MKSKLIIIRGNSGSGKTTIAQLLRNHFERGQVMLIAQDTLRLDILNTKDFVGNPTVDLVKMIAAFGKDKYDYIIIEGIFNSKIYKDLFLELADSFEYHIHAYYYDLSFEETVSRHSTRDKSKDFGPDKMKDWWLEKDYLNLENEKILDGTLSPENVLNKILSDLSI